MGSDQPIDVTNPSVSRRPVVDPFRRSSVGGPVRITSVGIPTRDRAPSLARCLASLADSVRRGEDSPDIIVVDDSSCAEDRSANRRMLASIHATYPGQLFYAGPVEKQRFARTLAGRTGLHHDTVAFALAGGEGFPIATGSSRNLLLLHAAGEAHLQLDDDIVCQIALAPGAQAGLVCTSRLDPTEFWFESDDEPAPAGSLAPHDLLAVHERLLGNDLGDCLSGLQGNEGPGLDGASSVFASDPRGRVRVTMAGFVGDSGMSSSLYFLLLDGASRDRLNCSEQSYRDAIHRHRVVRSVRRMTVAHGAFCQALNLGLDHRETLPPFLPVQRNQDGVFATLLKTCGNGDYLGFLPWVVAHEPPRPRALSSDGLVAAAAGVRCDQIVQLLIRTSAPRVVGTLDGNLEIVGEALERFGAFAEREFARTVDLVVRAQLRGLAGRLSSLLSEHGGKPVWWASDVRLLLRILEQRQAAPDISVPEDLRRVFGPVEALPALQRLVGRFGKLLRSWPVMVEAARDLRASGTRPAHAV